MFSFVLGERDGNGNPLISGIIGGTGTLAFTARPAANKEIRIRMPLSGNGAVRVQRLSGSDTANVYMDGSLMSPTNSMQHTFTGGVTVESNARLTTYGSSTLNTGTTAIHYGPLGTSTLTLAGGTVELRYGETGDDAIAIHNHINATADSFLTASTVSLTGSIRTNGNRLSLGSIKGIKFDDADFSASLSEGTLAFMFDNPSFPTLVDFNVSSGTSTFGGVLGENYDVNGQVDPDGMLARGSVRKKGEGAFRTTHLRSLELIIEEGTFALLEEGGTISGGTANLNSSRVHRLEIAGGADPVATLDLTNTEFIYDYHVSPGESPLANGMSSDLFQQIMSARNGGSWNGTGINSSSIQTDTGEFAIGFGESVQVLNMGTATTSASWGGQMVDRNAVLIRATHLGDANLSGLTDTDDFGMQAANFNESGLWDSGDFDYNGTVNIDDFGILAAHFNEGPELRPENPRLVELPGIGSAESEAAGTVLGDFQFTGDVRPEADWRRFTLYLAMLDHPQIYWEAHDRPDIWRWFAAYELLDLGVTIPERPMGLLAGRPSVPEPGMAMAALVLPLLVRRLRVG